MAVWSPKTVVVGSHSSWWFIARPSAKKYAQIQLGSVCNLNFLEWTIPYLPMGELLFSSKRTTKSRFELYTFPTTYQYPPISKPKEFAIDLIPSAPVIPCDAKGVEVSKTHAGAEGSSEIVSIRERSSRIPPFFWPPSSLLKPPWFPPHVLNVLTSQQRLLEGHARWSSLCCPANWRWRCHSNDGYWDVLLELIT